MENRLGRRLSLLFVIFCIVFTSSGQFFLKQFSENIELSYLIFLNIYFVLGIISYFFGATLLIFSLKYGELSFVYPMLSLTYIVVLFLSNRFLGEPVGIFKLLGVGTILCGVIIVGVGGQK